MNILLIQGGWSSERDVSLNSGREIFKALVAKGHSVTTLDPKDQLEQLIAKAKVHDFAFIALHGSPGEDGLIQAMLENAGCPFQGANSSSSILALDKTASKSLFIHAGLPTPPYCFLTAKPEAGWLPPFAFPIFVKANTGGSSLGMERVETSADLPAALERLFTQANTFLVEPAIIGQEVTCGVLGALKDDEEIPFALDPILIKPKLATTLFDYKSKYQVGGADEICPAPLEQTVYKRVQELALQAHIALGLSGYSRSDFIVPAQGEPMLLEINTLPGMTATSLIPKEAAVIGLSYADFVEKLIELGIARHKRNNA